MADTPDDIEQYGSNYSESGFWDKVKSVAKKAGKKVLRLAFTLYGVLKSEKVSIKDKAIIIGALGYFILPTDLIPDAIYVLGFTDDLAVLKLAYDSVKSNISKEIKEEANRQVAKLIG